MNKYYSLKFQSLFLVCFFFQNLLISRPLEPKHFGFDHLVIIDSSSAELKLESSLLLLNADLELNNLKKKPFKLLNFFRNKQPKNKKLIAAILAFPFPFGIVGLHRIYLGTAPYVPVVYIGTFGGIFGFIPLMDFVAILFEKDIEQYINNNKVFMWVK